MFPNNGSVTRPPPSLLPGSDGIPSPDFLRYYEAATTTVVTRPPSAFPALGRAASRLTSPVRSSRPGSRRPARLGVDHRFHPLRSLFARNLRFSQVPCVPLRPLPCSRTPTVPPARSLRRSGMAPAIATTRASVSYDFRGSIARLQPSLSTLRAVLTGDYARLASGG